MKKGCVDNVPVIRRSFFFANEHVEQFDSR